MFDIHETEATIETGLIYIPLFSMKNLIAKSFRGVQNIHSFIQYTVYSLNTFFCKREELLCYW